MANRLRLEILSQPTDTTCGPTCLHAVYRYYGDDIDLDHLIHDVPSLESGGTLAVFLATHALRRGYRAALYTYNLQVFDPTWFSGDAHFLRERLARRAEATQDGKLRSAIAEYQEFLKLGGEIRFEDLSRKLVRTTLTRGVPILTGLSATYLYRSPREYGPRADYDDIRGEPSGHFVVLCGYDQESKRVHVADPNRQDEYSFADRYYDVDIDRLICAILLGIVTYDANLLIIEKPKPPEARKGNTRMMTKAPSDSTRSEAAPSESTREEKAKGLFDGSAEDSGRAKNDG